MVLLGFIRTPDDPPFSPIKASHWPPLNATKRLFIDGGLAFSALNHIVYLESSWGSRGVVNGLPRRFLWEGTQALICPFSATLRPLTGSTEGIRRDSETIFFAVLILTKMWNFVTKSNINNSQCY